MLKKVFEQQVSDGPVERIVMSNRHLAVVTRPGTLTLYDCPPSRKSIVLATNHFIRSLTFSPDGRWLAAACSELTDGRPGPVQIKLWDQRFKELRIPCETPPQALTFSADSRSLIGILREHPALMHVPDGRVEMLPQTIFSAQGLWCDPPKHDLVVVQDMGIRVWRNGKEVRPARPIRFPEPLYRVAISPDGTKAVCGLGASGWGLRVALEEGGALHTHVQIWSLETREVLFQMGTDGKDLPRVACADQIWAYAPGEYAGQSIAVHTMSGQALARVDEPGWESVALAPSGQYLAAGHYQGRLVVWEIEGPWTKSSRWF